MAAPNDRDKDKISDDATVIGPASEGRLPERVGHYAIRRVIASGGMGTIYEALQENPRRTVAVKVMRTGVASPEALRRFEYESQILARLHHPGIAQIFEAGTHGEGAEAFPFFAMEYIANARPITTYAQEKKLDVAARLELFVAICDAVHHGHQKGIIHRDLKPGNILVDSSGKPRVIDFGVARATDSDMAMTFQTQVGQIIGSLQYMSPEQFDADPHDLDTRSDVYALGIILYELLVGDLPYDLSKTTIVDAARIVKEEPPPRPSTRGTTLPTDVETILQKAMEKDRDRRYQSAFGLASDIQRYLRGEAIVARPPSMVYQLHVFARRNKLLIAAVSAVFVALAVGAVVSTSMYVKAQNQREIAEAQTVKARAAVDFLREMLQDANPSSWGYEPTVTDMLEGASERMGDTFADEPSVEADIRRAIGMGYFSTGAMEASISQLESALERSRNAFGSESPETLPYYYDLMLVHQIGGHYEVNVDLGREVLAIEASAYGEESEEAVGSMYDLAFDLIALELYGEAEVFAKRAFEIRQRTVSDGDVETLRSRLQIAWIQLKRGDATGAETLSRDILAACRKNYGEGHRVTREAMSMVAATLITQGRVDDAAEMYANRPVPSDLGIEKVYQGTFDPAVTGTRMLVFWETWCPYSQRAIPGIEAYYERFKEDDFDVVGLTRCRLSSDDDAVRTFIDTEGVTFPMVREDGTAFNAFNARGTPWIVILQSGRIIWEKSVLTPEAITENMLVGLLGTEATPR